MVLSIVISFRKKTDTVPHACNSRTWEIEAGRSEIQGHHQLCTRDMSQEKKKKGILTIITLMPSLFYLLLIFLFLHFLCDTEDPFWGISHAR